MKELKKTIRQQNIFILMVFVHVCFCMRAEPGTNKPTQWENTKLRKIPVNYRTDGFSQYFDEDILTREQVERKLVDPLAKGGIDIIEWGLSTGSPLSYNTHVGHLFGEGLTDKQWKMVRKGDFRVYHNLKTLIDSGNDPFEVAIERAHKLGIKIFGRLILNKEYGPVGSWTWQILTDNFNKQHPEYRIPGSVFLDFAHKEVRERKLAILREIATQYQCDGIMLDFIPSFFFANPEKGKSIMTQFVRKIRKMLDKIGASRGRRLEFMVRIPYRKKYQKCLDWKRWMKDELIDYISVYTNWPSGDYFDVRMDEFVSYRNQIGSKCRVYGHIWQALGLIDTDPSPTGKKRYGKPKTRGMFYAQALIHNRVGCDGIELGFASPQQWKAFYGELGTPEKIEFADKRYMVDVGLYMPIIFDITSHKIRKTVTLRVADDINKARKSGYKVEAKIILYCRSLRRGEIIKVFVNGNGPLLITAESLKEQNKGSFVGTAQINRRRARNSRTEHEISFINKPNWWKKGEKKICFPAEWLLCGENRLDFQYYNTKMQNTEKLEIVWIDITLNYSKLSKE